MSNAFTTDWNNYFIRMQRAEMDEGERRMLELDDALRYFSKMTRQKLLMRLAQLGLKDRVALRKQLKKAGKGTEPGLYESVGVHQKKRYGQPESLSIKLERHGIFLEHGVGKYRPANSSAAAAAKKPWLSVILPHTIEDLAELLSNEYADVVSGYLKLNIPGIYSTEISL